MYYLLLVKYWQHLLSETSEVPAWKYDGSWMDLGMCQEGWILNRIPITSGETPLYAHGCYKFSWGILPRYVRVNHHTWEWFMRAYGTRYYKWVPQLNKQLKEIYEKYAAILMEFDAALNRPGTNTFVEVDNDAIISLVRSNSNCQEIDGTKADTTGTLNPLVIPLSDYKDLENNDPFCNHLPAHPPTKATAKSTARIAHFRSTTGTGNLPTTTTMTTSTDAWISYHSQPISWPDIQGTQSSVQRSFDG